MDVLTPAVTLPISKPPMIDRKGHNMKILELRKRLATAERLLSLQDAYIAQSQVLLDMMRHLHTLA